MKLLKLSKPYLVVFKCGYQVENVHYDGQSGQIGVWKSWLLD